MAGKYSLGMKNSFTPSVLQVHQFIDPRTSTILQLPRKNNCPISTNFILNLEPSFEREVMTEPPRRTIKEVPAQSGPVKKTLISKNKAEQKKKMESALTQHKAGVEEKVPEQTDPSDHEIAQSMKLLRELKDQVDELQEVFIKLMEKYPRLRIDILLLLNESRKLKNLNLLRGLKRRDALTNSPRTSSTSESW